MQQPVLDGSRSENLGVSPLGAGWAVALSLLVIHRAGMANQASTEPGEQRQKSGCIRGMGHEVQASLCLSLHFSSSGWTALDLSQEAFSFLKGVLVPHPSRVLQVAGSPDGPLSFLLLSALSPCSQGKVGRAACFGQELSSQMRLAGRFISQLLEGSPSPFLQRPFLVCPLSTVLAHVSAKYWGK